MIVIAHLTWLNVVVFFFRLLNDLLKVICSNAGIPMILPLESCAATMRIASFQKVYFIVFIFYTRLSIISLWVICSQKYHSMNALLQFASRWTFYSSNWNPVQLQMLFHFLVVNDFTFLHSFCHKFFFWNVFVCICLCSISFTSLLSHIRSPTIRFLFLQCAIRFLHWENYRILWFHLFIFFLFSSSSVL